MYSRVFWDEEDLGGNVLSRRGLAEPAIVAADPARHYRRNERLPCAVVQLDAAKRVTGDEVKSAVRMERLDLVSGVASNKVKDGEGAAGVCSEPRGGNAEEMAVVDDEDVAGEDAGSDGVSVGERRHGVGK